jgi:hypothetical protein
MASSDQSYQCSITNNSGRDIVITLALNGDESTTGNSVANAGRKLELLKTGSGDPVIKNGSTGTITLDRTYTGDSGISGAVADYDLLVCDPFWLSPLASLTVSRQADGEAGFTAQTVTKDTLVTGSQTIAFYQAIHTFPESALTKDYAAALEDAKTAARQTATAQPDNRQAVTEAIGKAMKGFFNTTKEYQQVTLAGVSAVDGYYKNFPSIWAQYKDSITYYIYAEDGENEVFAGILSLDRPGAIDLDADNGGYTCRFVPAVNPADTARLDVDTSKAVSLTYADGIFSDNAGAAKPSIALQGSFYLKKFFDGKIDDTKVVIIITGKINGLTCLGYDIPWLGSKLKHTEPTALQTGETQDTNNTGEDNIMDDWRGIAIVLGGFAGAILFLTASGFAVYQLARYVKYRILKKLLADWDTLENEEKTALADKFNKIGLDISDELGYDFVQQQAERSLMIMQRNKLGRAMVFQRMALEEMIKYAAKAGQSLPEEINALMSKIGNSQDRVWDENNVDNLKDILPEELTVFSGVQTKIGTIRQRIYDNNQAFRPQNTDAYKNASAKLFEEVENALKEEEREVKEIDPVDYEPIID